MTVERPAHRRPRIGANEAARPLDVGSVELDSIRRVDIDDMIEYVYAGTGPNLPSYLELYSRYLRQRWNVDDLDFTRDKADWERIPPQAKQTFLQIASGFHHGERQVAVELAPLFFGIPEEYKIFLSSHLEDEARHTVFFDRFYREVVGIEGESILDVLDGSYQYISETFVGPFGLLSYLTDNLRRDPYNKHLQMQYATTYMLWIEGVLALSVMKITLGYARDNKILPGYYTGFTATCRDEARHVQGGIRFIRDLLAEQPILINDLFETLRTILIMAGTSSNLVVYEPIGWSEESVRQLLGAQTRRKLKVVGIEQVPPDLEEKIQRMDPVLAGG